MADIDKLEIEIEASSAQAVAQIKALNDQLKGLKSTLSGKWNNPIKNIGASAGAAAKRSAGGAGGKASQEPPKAMFSDVQQKTGRVAESTTGSVEDATEKVNRLREAFNSLKTTAASAGKTLGGTAAAGFNKLKTAAQNALKPLTSLVSSFKRILFYRMVRTVIKQIGDAISTGMTNAYQFSKAIGGDLAASFDKLSSASYAAKNQFGAAFATALQAIAPVLIQIINLATRAASALAQLFAILGGKTTYLKANTDYMKKWGDSAKSAGGAVKDLKKQLIGIDELNVLQEPSSNGGGGAADALDFNDMFEETPLDAWTENVKKALDWVKNHLELIKDIALAVGAAFLAWKIANGFTDSLSKIIGIAMAVGGAVIYVEGFIDAWKNGIDWENLAKMIGGVAIAAIGLGIALGPVAAGIALIVGGIGLLVIGIKDWIENGELSTQTFWALAAGIAAVSIGIGLLTGSAGIGLLVAGIGALAVGLADWISTGELSTETFWMLEAGIVAVGVALALLISPWALVVAAVAAAALAIIKNWDEVSAWLSETWSNIKETASQVWNSIKDKISETWDSIKSTAQTKWSNIKTTISAKWSSIKSDASEKFNNVKEKVTGVWDDIQSKTDGVWNSVKSTTESVWNGIKSAIEDPIGTARDTVKGAIDAIKGFFDFEFTWPSLPIPHFTISPPGWSVGDLLKGSIPSLGISWYAKGGIVDGATLIGAGEAGKEAIIPLERNTEWINTVAAGLASRLEQSGASDSDAIETATDREISAIYEIANRIIRAIEDKDTTVRIDSRDITKAQNRYARAMGV